IGLHANGRGLRAPTRRHRYAVTARHGARTDDAAERVLFFLDTRRTLEAESHRGRVAQGPDVAVDALLPRSTRVDHYRVPTSVGDRHDHAAATGPLSATLVARPRRARVERRLEVVVDRGAGWGARRGETGWRR